MMGAVAFLAAMVVTTLVLGSDKIMAALEGQSKRRHERIMRHGYRLQLEPTQSRLVAAIAVFAAVVGIVVGVWQVLIWVGLVGG